MNSLKTIFITTMAASNLIVFAHDENAKQQADIKKREQQYALEREQSQKSTAIWAGVIGAVAGTAIGYWLGTSEAAPEITYYVEPKIDIYQYEYLSPKARQVKMQLDKLAKYGQNFNLYDDYSEQAVINNLYRLGIRLDQIDGNFYTKLAQDNKALSDAGYSIWWHGLKNLEDQKNLYLSNSKKLISYFNRHQDFIYGCQIINFYNKLPLYAHEVPVWARNQYLGKQYPLIACMQDIKIDKQHLMSLQRYSGQYIAQKACATQRMLDNVIDILYNSYAYQQEVDQKRQDELLIEYNRAERELLEIARQQTRALNEANRFAAERNRIEWDRSQNYHNRR